jgi:TonB-linked SusC/RagA family outer membrane protein
MKNALLKVLRCAQEERGSRDLRPELTNERLNLIKSFITMKLILLLTVAACMQAGAEGYSQGISLSLKNVSIEKVFAAIEKQSSYHFIYAKEELKETVLISLTVNAASINQVLDLCLKEQPLSYTLKEPYIIIKRKGEIKPVIHLNKIVKGKVVNEKGEPIPGATVTLQRSGIATASDDKGEFTISYNGNFNILVISNVGYEREETEINDKNFIEVVLRIAINSLDETIVIAYGNTTRRLNTGSVYKTGAAEIERQPVSNPLAALQGRVPGLTVTQTSGLSGGGIKVQIRGQNSLLQGSEPLYIIDGVPFAAGNTAINQLSNATSNAGLSPFNLINPADIESIEVLKDADATAIYGSRGANGVILISTKKGKPGKLNLSANMYSGQSRVTRTMALLNTPQYVAMRREAFANDGILPNGTNAPDIMVWDTSSYTDYKKLFTGGSATTSDGQISISGGNGTTQFLTGGGYHRETTVLPTDLPNKRASMHFNITHTTANKKLSFILTGNYSNGNNELTISDLTSYINLPPNVKLTANDGTLKWSDGGVLYSSTIGGNPLAALQKKYTGQFDNLIGNLQINYRVIKGLVIKANCGYNTLNGDETSINPSTSLDPNQGNLPFSYFANSHKKSMIIEPQAEYTFKKTSYKFSVLAGGSWQETTNKALSVYANNYSSDILLNSISGAGNISAASTYNQYKYSALFGRVNFNYKDRYIFNLSGRRDGSSRFGPGKQFSNFGAAGIAWLFADEPFFKKNLSFISYGKIRASYGITGNDQIGDYKFADTWTASSTTYQGTSTLNPSSLFNPDYEWETNKKMELALETGILKDRFLLTAAYFKNRCGNQIVNYTLPIQTGFSSIGKNLDALIQNSGWEFSLNSKISNKVNLKWNSVFILTIARNKLLAFPGLASSSYANTFIKGESVNTRKVYHYMGVNPATGFYQFLDADSNGTYGSADKISFARTDPRCYGGFINTISYKGAELSILFEFKKQTGKNYLSTQGGFFPGLSMNNQPVIVLDRWQKPGDNALIQKYTTLASTGLITAINNLGASDAVYSDASFIRCKNISLSYTIQQTKTKRVSPQQIRIYIEAQNLFTLTKYTGADPENQNIYVLPPLRTIAFGCQLQF